MKYKSLNNRFRKPVINSKTGKQGYDGGQLQLTCSAADTLKAGLEMTWKLPNDNIAKQVLQK